MGYPRRALRLHAAATAITEHHGGEVPSAYDELLALPGIGDYTAAAIAAFAYGQRQVVLDTNVRRVLSRTVSGVEFPPRSVTRAERDLGATLLPEGRYARMNNVWFLPSCDTLLGWLRKLGFREAKLVDVTVTTTAEQRSTPWMTFQSLAECLDPADTSRTVEGYPAPRRAIVTALAP